MSAGFERFPFRQHPRTGFTRGGTITLGTLFALAGAGLAVGNLRDGEIAQAVIVTNVMGVFSLLTFGVYPPSLPRGRFRTLNSVVMTRAERPPMDSWVHLAPTRALRTTLTVGFAWGSLGVLSIAAVGVLQLTGVLPWIGDRTSLGKVIFATILSLLIGGICAWFSGLLIWRHIRNGSFGTRPSGIALGATAVAVRVPGRDVEIPWARIASVSAEEAPLGRRGESIPMIRLRLVHGGESSGEQMLAGQGYKVPTDALYTALRWYQAHPEMRGELGRVEGERRLEAWRVDALTRASHE